jgi:hypothetical protein
MSIHANHVNAKPHAEKGEKPLMRTHIHSMWEENETTYKCIDTTH